MLRSPFLSLVLTLVALHCIALSALSQSNFTLSGVIKNQENGESLIGVSVYAAELKIGTTTNEYGFYSIALPKKDSITIEFSYVGFQTTKRRVMLSEDTKLNVELGTGVNLQEIVVRANIFEDDLNSTEMSIEAITTKEAKMIPVLLGESDILKTIQLKPGMPSGSEGTTGLFVRGGSGDQNLIVLDEAIIYNANHLFGFFSTFNTDAVKDLKLYKGGFPAQYGGRLSSVLDVRLKEGNNKKIAGSGGVGLISTRLTLEGPIKKEKSSFMVSGRRTYVDLLTRAINRSNEGNEDFTEIPDYFFYDLNTKINFELGPKDHLYLSGYFGRDVFGFKGDFFDFDFDWGNTTSTLRWNHFFSPKLFSNFTLTYSDYQYDIRNKITGFSFEVGSSIRDINLKSDFYYTLNQEHKLRFGLHATRHQFVIGRLQAGSNDGNVNFSSGLDFNALEFGAYVSDNWEWSEKVKISAGLRLSGFANQDQTYFGLEPRISAKYSVNRRLSLKASYARMYQYLHLVANSGITLPTDVWYPSTELVKPQQSDQIAVGVSYLLSPKYFLNIESYYKKFTNQIEFVDGAELFANDNLEREFAIGKGRGYGFELELEKRLGRLSGWIAYTLAFIEKGEFQVLDETQQFVQRGYFSPVFDRRHDISIVTMFQLSRRLQVTTSFVYGSGDLRWMPLGRFSFQDIQGAGFNSVIPIYQDRNNFRLPPYHRWDLGLVIRFFPKWGKSELAINIINVYDRRNIFFIYLQPEFEKILTIDGNAIDLPTGVTARQVSLFPILPSVSWNFEF